MLDTIRGIIRVIFIGVLLVVMYMFYKIKLYRAGKAKLSVKMENKLPDALLYDAELNKAVIEEAKLAKNKPKKVSKRTPRIEFYRK